MLRFHAFAALAILLILAPTLGRAQGAATPPAAAAFNQGYGGAGASVSRPTRYGLRDDSGNLVIVNGTLGGASGAFGEGFGTSGFGAGTAQAVGNQIVVNAAGSWNTIIIDAVQTNSGDVTATVGAPRAPTPTAKDSSR